MHNISKGFYLGPFDIVLAHAPPPPPPRGVTLEPQLLTTDLTNSYRQSLFKSLSFLGGCNYFHHIEKTTTLNTMVYYDHR